MAFTKGGNEEIGEESEAWNVAKHYTYFGIASPLQLLDQYEMIARFGCLGMDEELMLTDDEYDKRRAEAVKRYWVLLKQLIDATRFKIKKSHRDQADGIYNKCVSLKKYLDGLLSLQTNNVSHDDKIKVNEEFLEQVLDLLTSYKTQYLYFLDRAGLIFRVGEEIDLDKLTADFVHGG